MTIPGRQRDGPRHRRTREAHRKARFQVPYPTDPERRPGPVREGPGQAGAARHLPGHADEGTFRGSTPIGRFLGRYLSPAGSDVVEIELTEKPWLVTVSMIEHEVRKFLNTA
jgi:hypothetical protein